MISIIHNIVNTKIIFVVIVFFKFFYKKKKKLPNNTVLSSVNLYLDKYVNNICLFYLRLTIFFIYMKIHFQNL